MKEIFWKEHEFAYFTEHIVDGSYQKFTGVGITNNMASETSSNELLVSHYR